MTQVEKGSPHVSRNEVIDDFGYEEWKHPPSAMSVFNGKLLFEKSLKASFQEVTKILLLLLEMKFK